MSAWRRRLALAPSSAERACGGAYRRSTHARVGASRNVSGTSSSSSAAAASSSAARASSVPGIFSKGSSSPAKGARSAAHDARVVHGASHGRSACIVASKASSRNGEAAGGDEDDTVSSAAAKFFRRVSLSTTRRESLRASRSVTPKRATASARHTARKVIGSRSARRSNAPSRPCTRPNAVPADARTAAATAGGTTTRDVSRLSRLSPPRRLSSAPPENSSSSSPPPTPPAETHAPCLVAAHSPATNGAATRAYSGVAPCGAAAFTSAAVSKPWWCPRSSAEPVPPRRTRFDASFGARAPLRSVSRKRAPSSRSGVGDTDAST